MAPVIECLSKVTAKRKIAVLGDMLELGSYAKELHEKVGEAIVRNKIDTLRTKGENAEYIARKAEELHMDKSNIYICKNNKEAIGILNNLLQKEDTVLFKASRAMKLEEIIESIKE